MSEVLLYAALSQEEAHHHAQPEAPVRTAPYLPPGVA